MIIHKISNHYHLHYHPHHYRLTIPFVDVRGIKENYLKKENLMT
jgi:hypothetical protein